jgi:hypothetical protein
MFGWSRVCALLGWQQPTTLAGAPSSPHLPQSMALLNSAGNEIAMDQLLGATLPFFPATPPPPLCSSLTWQSLKVAPRMSPLTMQRLLKGTATCTHT